MSDPRQRPEGDLYGVTSRYLEVMKIPLLEGRFFEDADAHRNVAIIDESMARRYFPGQSALGHRFAASPDGMVPAMEVIGVVGHVESYGLDGKGPVDVALVAEIDPAQPIFSAQSMEQVLDDSVGDRKLILLLISIFSALALLLASVGVYGVMSYAVSQRTREIGIRMALGATSRTVAELIVGQGVRLALLGVVLGAAGGLAISGVLRGLLFGVSATDPLTYMLIACILAATTIAACWLPAHRASRVDPSVALRAD